MGLCMPTPEVQKSIKILSHPITSQSILKSQEKKSANALKPGENHLKNTDLEEEKIEVNFSCQKGAKIISEKFHGPAEKPKTANKAFGGISDFLLFFENRNPQMKEFAKEFRKIEDKKDSKFSIAQLNKAIAPKIEECLNDTYQKLKTTTKSIMFRTNKYAGFFLCKFKTWEEFYKQILRAYTINGFLYLKMNEYLRNENWMELNALLPYTYSLFKAFLWGSTGLTMKKNFEALKGKVKGNKLILYRGVDFDDKSLKFYDPKKIKNFSWNGVISTSLLDSVIEKFQASEKPTMIIIEIDFEDLQPGNLNVLYLAECSAHSEEQEVALPPGSIFELLEMNKENPQVVMRLRLVTNAKVLAHQGQFLHGMLQSLMRNEKELKIVCLTGKDLSRAIKHCKGNLLIEDLEFGLCDFNQNAADVLREILPTMKNLASFTLNTVGLQEDCGFDHIIECFGGLKIRSLEILDSFHHISQVESFMSCMQYMVSLRNLKLTFTQTFLLDRKLLKDLCDSATQYLNSQCLFELKIHNNVNIFTKKLKENSFQKEFEKVLSFQAQEEHQELQELQDVFEVDLNVQAQISKPNKEINRISRDFAHKPGEEIKNQNIIEQDIESIFHILNTQIPLTNEKQIAEGWNIQRNLTGRVQALSIAFNDPKILSSLNQMKDQLDSLTILKLSFGCFETTNKDVESFWRGIRDLESLTSFSLDFNPCTKMTNSGLSFLKHVRLLKSLTELHINFSECLQITDEDLRDFLDLGSERVEDPKLFNDFLWRRTQFSKGLILSNNAQLPTSLTNLHLNFRGCFQIPNKGLLYLCHGIPSLQLLEELCLNFEACIRITDRSLLYLQNMQVLRLLTVLDLNFNGCLQITDRGLDDVRVGISHFKLLKKLCLRFEACNKITDKGLAHLVNIQNLRSLTVLDLSFSGCLQIADKGFKDFCESISSLCSLNTIHLNFSGCVEITNAGLKNLCLNGIRHLKRLKSLFLNFNKCNKITEEGVQILCNQGVRRLKSLESLFLSLISTGIQKEFESNICKFDSLATYGIILSNGIGKRDIEGFNLRQLVIKREHKQNNIGDFRKQINDQIMANIVCFQETTFSFEKKLYILNEDNLEMPYQILRGEEEMSIGIKGSNASRDSKSNRKIFQLTFFNCENIANLLKSIFSGGVFISKSLLVLNLSFDNCLDLTDDKLENLSCHVIQPLKSLKTLHLRFEGCRSLTGKGLKSLCCEGIWHLSSLHVLQLVFDSCWNITDEGLKSTFCQKTQFLGTLNTLHLSFRECDLITDEGLKALCLNGIQHFESLESLYLNFSWCQKITDEGFRALCQGIQNLSLLKTLDLNFDGNTNITDKEFVILGSHAIRQAQFLTTLNLSFIECPQITDEGLEFFYHKGIEHIKFLTKLCVDFDECSKITTDGFERFYEQVILQLPELHASQPSPKSFNFSPQAISFIEDNQNSIDTNIIFFDQFWFYFSDNPSKVECSLNNLLERASISNAKLDETQERHGSSEIRKQRIFDGLTLSFDDAWKVTDDDFSNLKFGEGIMLGQLETCHFVFDGCSKITGEGSGFASFYRQVITNFQSLTTLHLSFKGCKKMTNEGLRSLRLENLSQLEALSLNLDGTNRITDDGFQYLCRHGISHLHSLKSLDINLNIQSSLSNEGLLSLCGEGIKDLDALTSLKFVFNNGEKITEKGLKSLISQGMSRLTKLENVQISLPQNLDVSPTILQAFLRILFYFGFVTNSDIA